MPPPDLSDVRRVAVLRALPGLGDLLFAVPFLRALRGALPRAEIAFVGLEHASWIVERYPYADELVVLPGFPGLPEVPPDPRRAQAFLAAIQAQRFDLAVQAHGSGLTTTMITALLGAG